MNFHFRTAAVFVVFLVFCVARAVTADAAINYCGGGDGECFTQMYVGLSGGEADWNLSSDAGLPSIDEKDNFYGGMFGYRMNKFFAFEVGANNLGEPDYVGLTDVRVYNYAVGLNFYLPLGSTVSEPDYDNIALFAKAGMHFWDFSAKGGGNDYGDDGTDLFYGLGMQVDMSKLFAVRADHTVYQLSIGNTNSDISTTALSFLIKF